MVLQIPMTDRSELKIMHGSLSSLYMLRMTPKQMFASSSNSNTCTKVAAINMQKDEVVEFN